MFVAPCPMQRCRAGDKYKYNQDTVSGLKPATHAFISNIIISNNIANLSTN